MPALIKLLQEVRSLDNPDLPKDTLSQYTFIWTRLPGFINLWADMYDHWRSNLSSTLSSLTNPNDRIAKRQFLQASQTRLTKIKAHMTVADEGGFQIDEPYDTLAEAMESDDVEMDFEISAAREWIRIAGKQLYEGAEHKRKSWGLRKDRGLWKGGQSMSLERWYFWENRMGELADVGKVAAEQGVETGVAMGTLRKRGNVV